MIYYIVYIYGVFLLGFLQILLHKPTTTKGDVPSRLVRSVGILSRHATSPDACASARPSSVVIHLHYYETIAGAVINGGRVLC